MTIELANRLIEFRKKFGYSQEELANLLSVSRQSISNWESGEVTPSIDYLKELAKIYGVTLDDLISSDKTVEDALNKKTASDKDETNSAGNTQENNDTKKHGDRVHISKDGIHVESGNDRVDIDGTGVHINDGTIKDCFGNCFNSEIKAHSKKYTKYMKRKRFANKISSVSAAIMSLLVIIAYILLGVYAPKGWAIYWTLFILIPVPGEIIATFIEGKLSKMPIALMVTFAYLFGGMYMGLWHPYWLEFLFIPIYYIIVDPIDKLIVEHRYDKNEDDSVITINGEDIKVHASSKDRAESINKDFIRVEDGIENLKTKISKTDEIGNDVYKDLKDDLKDYADDLADSLDDIEEVIDDLEDEGVLTFDEKILYRTRLGKDRLELSKTKEKI